MVRKAKLKDVPRLLQMGERFIAETSYADKLPHNKVAQGQLFKRLILKGDGVIYVAQSGDVVCAMLGLFAYENPITGELVVGEMFWWSEPEYRGHGLPLRKAGEAWAKAKGAKKFNLIAPSGNDRAKRLYNALGYIELETHFQKAL